MRTGAYFKSTDGHMHQWAFSLKRSNLPLAAAIEEGARRNALSGCILVDSTRKGKRFPDALSKTVPIWCAVLTMASTARYAMPPPTSAADLLHVPHDAVSDTTLLDSDLPIPRLTKRLQPHFVYPTHTPRLSEHTSATRHYVVLVSASVVGDVPLGHANYVQGAGDDHESWARGLTPSLFWAHATALLSAAHDELDALVDELVAGKGGAARAAMNITALTSIGHDPSRSSPALGTQSGPFAASTAALALGIPRGKRGLADFSRALPRVVDAATEALLRGGHVLVTDDDGDISGGLAVAVLAACYDERRALVGDGAQAPYGALTQHRRILSKDVTQRRLQWFVSSCAAAPSRSHLQRVNAFLMGPHRQVRLWEAGE
ncbi:tRNA A64-2'-O-ribosylphosphate transferase [Malassezia sp. CBS 17886]|nr:tRNA A64-2'-O-ribosylphosphate transferase [Malassezia sp. CBS 17886]